MLRIILLTCVLVFAVCPAAAAADRPETALAEIQKAIEARDMGLLEKRMDFDALLDQGLDAFFDVLKNNAASVPPAFALMAATADTPQLQQALRKLLKSETINFIRYGVESGHFAGKADPSARPAGLVASILDDVSLGSKSFRSHGAARIKGETASLPAILHDGGNNRDYPLELRLSRQDGVWRVTGLDNLHELTARLRKESEPSK